MRRSSRNAGASAKETALADLARLKAENRVSRTATYELHEEAPIYDQVDEATYAAIAARKRKEARDFLANPDAATSDPDDDDADLDAQFDLEDQLSLLRGAPRPAAPGRKRHRVSAHAPRKHSLPAKRLASAFFQRAAAAPPALREPDHPARPVLDLGQLGAELEAHVAAPRIARRKRKHAVARAVGDLLFDTPAAPLAPVAPEPEVDEYAAPPPSLTAPSPAPPAAAAPPPKLEPLAPADNSLDADALLAAVAAAETDARTKRPPPAPTSTPTPAVRTPAVAPAPSAGAPLRREPNGDVLLFWTDAHEVRVSGGEHLYLFGKAAVGAGGAHASVCVQVRDVERTLYVLPRSTRLDARGRATDKPVSLLPDVHAEISERLLARGAVPRAGGLGGRGPANLPVAIKAKAVVRSCPFGDPDAPREPTEYLKVKFPYANVNKLQPDSYGSTFKRVFGTKTSASEHLCLKKKLKGPGWIRLSNAMPTQSKVSHARFTLSIPNLDSISVATDMSNSEPPSLSALCLNTKTVLNPRSGAHEIVMLSGIFVKDVPLSGPLPEGALEAGGPAGTRDFVLVRPPDGQSIPFGFSDRARSVLARGGGVEVVPNEAALLNNFLTKLLRMDPDVILGHDMLGFGLDVLIARMSVRRSREWSRLGRLVQRRDLAQVVKNNTSTSWFKSEAVAGRLVVDTYAYAKELLMREKDYSISALAKSVLGASEQPGVTNIAVRPSTDVSVVPKAYESTDSLCRLLSECTIEARTTARLAAHLSVVPLSRQLTCISGNLWSHTLRGARAERIEYLLCHEFKLVGSKSSGTAAKAGDVAAKLLLPDKLSKSDRSKLLEAVETQLAANAVMPKKEESTVVGDGVNAAATAGYGGGYGGPEAHTTAKGPEKSKGNAQSGKAKSARRKPQYSGGLVLEPKKGFYDRYVLQLDFNSLYPSIIQEFNICFTTLDLSGGKSNSAAETTIDSPPDRSPGGSPERSGAADVPVMMPLPNSSLVEGVLPRVLRRLVQQRRQVKGLLKDERKRAGVETVRAQQLDIRQLAIKLTANSLYGCLGFEASRFFARPLAEMVTSQGRETLQKTVDLARESFNAQVIYGDTDSLFVYTGLEDIARVRKLGSELKRDVNKKYRTLEIEIDAIYKKMLLLKKKKYAALKVVDPNNPDKVIREVKGLDLVRHDWCDLSHDASEHFLTQIFRGQASNIDDAVGNILTFLGELAGKVNNNQVALSKYVITRSITKKPQDYPDGKGLPHVAVALRLINTHKKRVKPGDYIKYVVCVPEGGSQGGSGSQAVASRAYHPDEILASEGKLVIDVKYYLENQVLPPIMRLCDPIENIEASRIAVALGLDGRRYEKRDFDDADGSGNYLALGPQSAAEKYRDVDPFMVDCARCGAKTEFRGVIFNQSGKAVKSSGLECIKCNARFATPVLANTITLTLRAWIKKYYTTPLVLNGDDGSRKRETRNIALGGNGALAKRKFDEAWLYKQLRYMQSLMDVSERWTRMPGHADMHMPMSLRDAVVYDEMLQRVIKTFDANAYRYIDIAQFLVPLGIA